MENEPNVLLPYADGLTHSDGLYPASLKSPISVAVVNLTGFLLGFENFNVSVAETLPSTDPSVHKIELP